MAASTGWDIHSVEKETKNKQVMTHKSGWLRVKCERATSFPNTTSKVWKLAFLLNRWSFSTRAIHQVLVGSPTRWRHLVPGILLWSTVFGWRFQASRKMWFQQNAGHWLDSETQRFSSHWSRWEKCLLIPALHYKGSKIIHQHRWDRISHEINKVFWFWFRDLSHLQWNNVLKRNTVP